MKFRRSAHFCFRLEHKKHKKHKKKTINPYLAFFLAIYGIVCRVTITASSEKYVDISDMICVETAAVIVTYIVDKEEVYDIFLFLLAFDKSF